jgi:hypothetical protein
LLIWECVVLMSLGCLKKEPRRWTCRKSVRFRIKLIISILDNWVSFWKLTSNKQDFLSNITVTLTMEKEKKFIINIVYCIFVLFLSPAVLHPYMDNEIDLIMSCVHRNSSSILLYLGHFFISTQLDFINYGHIFCTC